MTHSITKMLLVFPAIKILLNALTSIVAVRVQLQGILCQIGLISCHL